MSTRPAVFLDRDGTVMVERSYLADPDGVELLPGATAALRRLRAAGYALVLVTNQSGIGRGFFTISDFQAVQERLLELLAAEGIGFDGAYLCPHRPEDACACRKPAPLLFQQAAAELQLDLATSAFIGDRISDVAAARACGGRALLVRTGYGAGQAATAPPWVEVVDDLAEAADRLAGPP